MTIPVEMLTFIKYLLGLIIVVAVLLTPAWLACQTSKSKQDTILVRLASWIFVWTGIGWLWSLFWSSKK